MPRSLPLCSGLLPYKKGVLTTSVTAHPSPNPFKNPPSAPFFAQDEVAALAWHTGPFTFGLHPASSVFFLLTAHRIPCGLHPPSKPLSLMHLSLCLWAKPFPLSGVPGSSCILQPYFQVPRQIASPKESFLSFQGKQKVLLGCPGYPVYDTKLGVFPVSLTVCDSVSSKRPHPVTWPHVLLFIT